MNVSHSDALVFFGATGDLAYKKIFPSLQAMVKRGTLMCRSSVWPKPVGTSISSASERRTVLEKHGGINPAAFDKLCSLLALC
jgi:glucose-6-phosphate 1-dehydrogenase